MSAVEFHFAASKLTGSDEEEGLDEKRHCRDFFFSSPPPSAETRLRTLVALKLPHSINVPVNLFGVIVAQVVLLVHNRCVCSKKSSAHALRCKHAHTRSCPTFFLCAKKNKKNKKQANS